MIVDSDVCQVIVTFREAPDRPAPWEAPELHAEAVVLNAPHDLAVTRLALNAPGAADVVVETLWSGISTGTERLLYTGTMPAFPGMGYPLVPGYESVGWVTHAGADAGVAHGAYVFVPGAKCFSDALSLFGAAASQLVVAGERVVPISAELGERGILLALAATAYHAVAPPHSLPELIVGHGVLGRLLARIVVALGGSPTVWELDAGRMGGAMGYPVVSPTDDDRRDYACVCDASGDVGVLDSLVGRLRPGGEIVLAGFYSERVSFAFAPAFMREARLRIAAQWQRADMEAAHDLVRSGALPLDGLITHCQDAPDAPAAYRTAFGDASCLKMILDWRACA